MDLESVNFCDHDLSFHAWNLAELLFNLTLYDAQDLSQPAEWLRVLAAVKTIEIDFGRYDMGRMFCPTDEEWDAEQDDFYQKAVRELTKFNYAWGAFEYLSRALLKGRKLPVKGKVNEVCYWLKHEHEPQFKKIKELEIFTASLRSRILRLEGDNRELRRAFNKNDAVGDSGLGIYAVYRLRNHFAHGALRLSSGLGGNLEQPVVGISHISAHIVLLTIQMMLTNWSARASESHGLLQESEEFPEEWTFSEIVLNLHKPRT